jgi:hypothetical protein
MPSFFIAVEPLAMDSARRMTLVRSARAVLLLVLPLLILAALPAAAPGFDGRSFGRSLVSADARQLTIAPSGLAYALYAADNGNRPIAYSFTTSELGARGTTALPANTWTHLAVTHSASTLRLFVNETQVVSRSVGTPLQASTLPLRIGGNAVWNEWFRGRIDEVRLYNRALAATEIQSDMTRPVTAAGASGRSARPRANSRLARRNLRRARRHASVRRERARRSLPLSRHAPGRRGR